MTNDSHALFAVPFRWDSAVGRLVELIEEHATTGLVIEVGAGRAPAAERLRQRGYEYAAVVESSAEVDELRRRGFRAECTDLDDSTRVVDLVDRLVETATAPVTALVLVDVLERLSDPDEVLTALRTFAERHAGVLVGVSATNVAHRSVALSLERGRFRPLGPGPHHHTRATWLDRLAMAGFAETARRDVVDADLKPDEVYDPAVSDGAQLGALFASARRRADEHADTVRFVSLCGPCRPRVSSPVAPAPAPPFLAVVVPTAAADRISVELAGSAAVVPYAVDDDLAGLVERVVSPYLCFLGGAERISARWVGQFVDTATRHPGAIIRCASTDDSWPARANQYDLLAGATAPSAAFAVPTAAVASARERPMLVDGRFDLLPLLLDVAPLCGIVDSGVAALGADDDWQRSELSDVATADDDPYLGPPGSRRFLADLIHSQRSTDERVVELEADNAALQHRLDRREVRLAARVGDVMRRVRRVVVRR